MAIYVVYSGQPAGEIYDREVHLVVAETPEEALTVCNIGTEDCCHEWLWGPHAKEIASLEEAVSFAVYRASDGGHVYSYIAAHGFENNQQIEDMVYAKATE
jgi:hypothetical protein